MPDSDFKRISKRCPWRIISSGSKFVYCSGLEPVITSPNNKKCKEINCAPFLFALEFQNKG